MIKLLWNTHNQSKTITSDKDIKKKEAVDYKWGIYHKKKIQKLGLLKFYKKLNMKLLMMKRI